MSDTKTFRQATCWRSDMFGNIDHIGNLKKHLAALGEHELRQLAAEALFHLRCVSGSRNSFKSDYLEAARIAGVGFPSRDVTVEAMHKRAYEFLREKDL